MPSAAAAAAKAANASCRSHYEVCYTVVRLSCSLVCLCLSSASLPQVVVSVAVVLGE